MYRLYRVSSRRVLKVGVHTMPVPAHKKDFSLPTHSCISLLCILHILSFCCVLCLVTQCYLTLCHPMDCSLPGSSVHVDFPGKNTGVSFHALLQRVFSILGLNQGLLHCRLILYQLSCQGSPRILDWIACQFSSGSSWPGIGTRVSCIAGGFFTNWATREALQHPSGLFQWCCCLQGPQVWCNNAIWYP